MVEVDVFWAYGIGAGFALAAARPITAGLSGSVGAQKDQAPEEEPVIPGPIPTTDPYLLVAALYCAALFAPSGAWLLWDFPSWETMHAGSYETVPGWLVALFAATNTTQGVLGYLITRWLLRAGRFRLAAGQLMGAYFGMFFILVHGWDGKGYERFFSETRADFDAWDSRGVADHIGSWVGSDVALTLYGMGVVLLPVMFWLYLRWHQAGRRAAGLPTSVGSGLAIFGAMHGVIWIGGLGGAIVASVLIHLLGWPIGVVLALALGTAVLWPRRGPFAAAARRFTVAVPPAQRTPTEPVVRADSDEVPAMRSR